MVVSLKKSHLNALFIHLPSPWKTKTKLAEESKIQSYLAPKAVSGLSIYLLQVLTYLLLHLTLCPFCAYKGYLPCMKNVPISFKYAILILSIFRYPFTPIPLKLGNVDILLCISRLSSSFSLKWTHYIIMIITSHALDYHNIPRK